MCNMCDRVCNDVNTAIIYIHHFLFVWAAFYESIIPLYLRLESTFMK